MGDRGEIRQGMKHEGARPPIGEETEPGRPEGRPRHRADVVGEGLTSRHPERRPGEGRVSAGNSPRPSSDGTDGDDTES